MSVDQLIQTTLRERAEGLKDEELVGRAVAVRRRVTIQKRRRAAAGVAGAVAVVPLAIAAMLGGNPFGSPVEPLPADPVPSSVLEPRSEFAGRTLIRSEHTEEGRELSMTVSAPNGSEWQVTCAGVGEGFTLHQTLDGEFERTAPCSRAVPALGTMSWRFSDAEPAGNRELRLWITRAGEDAAVEPADALLGAAVYDLPDPVAVVAGSDVMPLEEFEGTNWAFAEQVESEPGDRLVSIRVAAYDGPRLLELASSGSGARQVRLLVDDVAQPVVGGSRAGTYDLGSVNVGDQVTPGVPHTITLEILGDVPVDARLGIVVRTPAS